MHESKKERALSGRRSEAANNVLQVMPHTLPEDVRSLCALKNAEKPPYATNIYNAQ
jgi:hypothetical protein